MSDLRVWLRTIGFEMYAETLIDQGIELDLLPELSDGDLEKCGIHKLGHRKRLLKAIGELNSGRHPTVPEAAEKSQSPVPERPQAAERRHLTVMFCDLVGATMLSTQYDPEDLRRIVGTYHEVVRRAVAPFEGYLAQLLGDGVLLFFGFPRAHDDEAMRAVRAGLEIVAAIKRTDFGQGLRLQARIGIATGLVVVGEIGTGTPAAEAGISGQTPNLAARLQGEAPPMGIVIAGETRRQIGEAFQLEALGALTLKGFAATEQAWRVIGERASFTRFDALRGQRYTSAIGRDRELAYLLDRWTLSREGAADLAVLSADLGLGKSLVTKVLRERIERTGGTALTLQCSAYHQRAALRPVIQWFELSAAIRPGQAGTSVLSQAYDTLSSMGVELSAGERQWMMALLSPSDLAADLARLPTHELQRGIQATLAAILLRISRVRPLLLIVEDAQWIDPTTEELISHVAQRLRSAAMLCVITCRPDFQPAWLTRANATRLTLTRLGQHACEQIIGAICGKSLPDAVVREILIKADGVPLFVEEITRTVLASGVLSETESAWTLNGSLRDLAVPATLRDSLMTRIDHLTLSREVLQVAAAIGREFEPALIEHVLGIDSESLQAALKELEDAALVLCDQDGSTGKYAFKHALVRDVAYDRMLKSVRVDCHRLIAAALEDLRPESLQLQPEEVATHYQQAGDDERAWPLWKKAGENAARRRYAFEQALEFYDNALQAMSKIQSGMRERTFDLLLLKEAVLSRLGRLTEQTSAIGECIRLAQELDDPDRKAIALLRKASALSYSGDGALAKDAALEALQIYRKLADRSGESEALRELGFLHWRLESYGDALQFGREALAIHRSVGDAAGEATALHNLAEIFRGLGSPKQALEWYGQALQLHWAVGNRNGEILTLFGIATALHQAGDSSGSRKKYEDALAMSERYGERTMQSRALQALAIQSRIHGALDDALSFMVRAIEVDRSIHYVHALSHDLVELSAIHLLRNERDAAKSALREAIGWCEFSGARDAAASAHQWLEELDTGRTPALGVAERPGGIKSHLPLPEGKVYCEFESPLAATSRR